MAIYSNIVIDQGTDYSASIDVTDADGDALNLTGHTGKGQVRKTFSSTSQKVDFNPVHHHHHQGGLHALTHTKITACSLMEVQR